MSESVVSFYLCLPFCLFLILFPDQPLASSLSDQFQQGLRKVSELEKREKWKEAREEILRLDQTPSLQDFPDRANLYSTAIRIARALQNNVEAKDFLQKILRILRK